MIKSRNRLCIQTTSKPDGSRLEALAVGRLRKNGVKHHGKGDQGTYNHYGEAASEDYLAAATFVSQRARRRPRAKLATRFRSSNQNAGPASATNAPPMNRTTPRPPSKDDEFGF